MVGHSLLKGNGKSRQGPNRLRKPIEPPLKKKGWDWYLYSAVGFKLLESRQNTGLYPDGFGQPIVVTKAYKWNRIELKERLIRDINSRLQPDRLRQPVIPSGGNK